LDPPLSCFFIYINKKKAGEGGGPMRKNLTGQARYSSTNKQISSETFTLNPLWVTGFSDAEGSFNMSIFKSKTAAIG